MATAGLNPLVSLSQDRCYSYFTVPAKKQIFSFPSYSSRRLSISSACSWTCIRPRFILPTTRLSSKTGITSRIIRSNAAGSCLAETDASSILFKKTFTLTRTEIVDGRISVKLNRINAGKDWELTIGCNLPGKWILHWGVTYCGDTGSEWDQPPLEMRPAGSVSFKDYAIETPLEQSPGVAEGHLHHEVRISFSTSCSIAAINFVLKDMETGSWCHYRGRDFRILLTSEPEKDDIACGSKGFNIFPGAFSQLSTFLLSMDGVDEQNKHARQQNQQGCLEEFAVSKQQYFENILVVFVQKCPTTGKKLVHFDTDLPGEVVVHWGVSHDLDKNKWEIPTEPHPPGTKIFRKNALQTPLQRKDADGSVGVFTFDKDLASLFFVLKLNGSTWLDNKGDDFFIPVNDIQIQSAKRQEKLNMIETTGSTVFPKVEEADQIISQAVYTNGVIENIRNLVGDISSKDKTKLKSKETREKILHEIDKLAAEAYVMFRSSSPPFAAEPSAEADILKAPQKICPGTGSGFEILCQGFNWESHRSGKWYLELGKKVEELSALGFTVIWLPPPTESVSPEGYMPRDLYNLNSRYGSMEDLKHLVKSLHEVGIKVLGDVVLNHRCAHYQNQNGVWNIFGGRLNWDDRAVVSDDPHFQGRGNKSSGDHFHAAPNIDHSQEFVQRDLTEWLKWLRKEVGYDGWRLDFVRGFWGGYVKEYLEATEPYFAVGEYWDSLSYTYGNLDHNQDAHRQRIIDWINAANGAAGAFDVTTKGILHAALEKCEYWRLSDEKGKPPGVVGWWPSRAVMFIENHDTGSTQGHWRFPSGKEMQGYAYILTHPGTPSIFYDHIFSCYQHEISQLMSLRQRTKLHCRSIVKIVKAERDVYAALIDDKVAVKIGPGSYDPQSGSGNWALTIEGSDYKVWEALR